METIIILIVIDPTYPKVYWTNTTIKDTFLYYLIIDRITTK